MHRLLALTTLLSASWALAKSPLPPAEECTPTPGAAGTFRPRPTGDAKVRQAAQQGLFYLSKSTSQWIQRHACYGCHVQAVTMEGLVVGKHHQYEVPTQEFEALRENLLRAEGGARGPQGFHHPSFPRTARTFGGLAVARYDQYIDSKLTDDLLKVAQQLLEYQDQDGAVRGDHQGYPVTTGVMQSTYQAMQTWRQAYARTADDAWLSPTRRAERYLADAAAKWEGNPSEVYLQDVNYALMGLVASGVTRSEKPVARLAAFLAAKQNQDGGWAFRQGEPNSHPFATGQTVYALRLAGWSEQDPVVARGIQWLVKAQRKDGGWSGRGSDKAEAMWAVLGLVSVDVLSVGVAGLQHGEHLEGIRPLTVTAKDNQGGGVTQVELFLDDRRLSTRCGSTLTHPLDARALATGKHLLEVVATNAQGQQSRRTIEFYSGKVFLTSLATRFTAQGTQLTFRNLAPRGVPGTVQLRVRAVKAREGTPQPGAEVFARTLQGQPGAMSFTWEGRDPRGKLLPRGRYYAEVAMLDAAGKVLQTESTLFMHDSAEVQRQQYGEVAGAIGVGPGGKRSGNTLVELVDERGTVVQTTRSNESGLYRFKSVDSGKYKVRVRKEGWAAREMEVNSEASKVAPADVSLH